MSTYVQQEIDKKNRWVYFRKGRWMVHICYWIFVFIIEGLQESFSWKFVFESFFLGNLLIAVFYYIYCLYLIPYFFKRNRMKTFWAVLLLLLVTIPALNALMTHITNGYTDAEKKAGVGFTYEYGKGIGIYLLNFILFSVLLFFMEMSERISTMREQEQERRAIEETGLSLLKTQVSPAFVMQALNRLEEMTVKTAGNVPGAVISFSDLLRYRLYRSKNHLVPLIEEIQALQAFIAFETDENSPAILLEQQGISADNHIVPLTLINLAELWFRDTQPPTGSLQLILVAESGELTAELHYDGIITPHQEQELENYRQQLAVLYDNKAIFDRYKSQQSNIISICLPLTSNRSAALS